MTPTFLDFFKSFYYSNTYLPPVDLTEQALSHHLLEGEDPQAATVARQLISDPEVRQALSEPFTYDLSEGVPARNTALRQHGFTLLSHRPDRQTGQEAAFYSVMEHAQLPGWIIKAGAIRVPHTEFMAGPLNNRNEMAFFEEEESLFRIEMAHRIAQVAREANIDVVIPKKKLITYAPLEGITDPTRKYCVVCEKINVLSVEDTVKSLKGMDASHQREMARKIATIVKRAGFVDASFDNIRLAPDGKLAFIDTEPVGLMIAKKTGLGNRFFGRKGASVEKCARVGLFTLLLQASKIGRGTDKQDGNDGFQSEPGLEAFHAQVKEDYGNAVTPRWSRGRIAVGVVSIGLIPMIHAIIALVETRLTRDLFKKLESIDALFRKQWTTAASLPPEEHTRRVNDYLGRRTPLAKQFFAYIEGVPYRGERQQAGEHP